uniref:BPTI/Kunitz inhibitor domain-containing protein n=1 Tax=Cyprinus carpio TaxID=7962 RepID=A0A8C1NIB6_CYPCA
LHWVPAYSVNICECCCYYSGDPTHITESCYQLFLVHLQQMEGLGPGVVAAVGELSQEQGQQALVEGCLQTLDPGPCQEYVVKWYFDPKANSCAQFWFGGCQGNKNQFDSQEACRKSCVKM